MDMKERASDVEWRKCRSCKQAVRTWASTGVAKPHLNSQKSDVCKGSLQKQPAPRPGQNIIRDFPRAQSTSLTKKRFVKCSSCGKPVESVKGKRENHTGNNGSTCLGSGQPDTFCDTIATVNNEPLARKSSLKRKKKPLIAEYPEISGRSIRTTSAGLPTSNRRRY